MPGIGIIIGGYHLNPYQELQQRHWATETRSRAGGYLRTAAHFMSCTQCDNSHSSTMAPIAAFLILCGLSYSIIAFQQVNARNGWKKQLPSRVPKAPSYEKQVISQLLKDYRRIGIYGRPVINASQPVHVDFGLGLIQMELDEKNNMLTMSAWSKIKWRDQYLTWDPDDYGGITAIRIPPDRIWIPDIMLYNTATTEEYERHALAVIKYDGNVTWYPQRLFKSSCALDVTNYPFDNQTCTMVFGSWTHTLREIDISASFPQGIDLSTYSSSMKESSKWYIIDIHSLKHEVENTFSMLVFTLELRRKMMFSSYILTLPPVFLSFLTLAIFWLPAEDAEKSVLGLTIFSSILLLLLILVEAAPPTASAVPLLGIYYCFVTVIVILSVFISCVIVKLGKNKSSQKRVPRWAKIIVFDVLGRLLCLRKHSKYFDNLSKNARLGMKKNTLLSHGNGQTCAKFYYDPIKVKEAISNGMQDCLVTGLLTQIGGICDLLDDIFSRYTARQEKDDLEKAADEEWKLMATILDRLFFFIYLIAVILALIVLFPRPT